MKRFLLFTLFVLGLFATALAQERVVTGKVTDAANEPLPGVAVVQKGTTKGTVTDLTGTFRISVSGDKAALVFKMVGLKTQEVVVGNQSVISVSMQEDATELSEVVVTALGVESDRKALGYAVQEVKSADLIKARETNVVNSLSGRIAGVQVTSASGAVGASARILLRGNGSITGSNQPLFVVDGIPISNSSFGGGDQDGTNNGNGAADINPDDVESISVLTGNAAAIYGSRAANGVVLVTTKKGRRTTGAGISVNSTTSFESPFRLPNFQDGYGQGNAGQFSFVDGAGAGVNDGSDESWGPRLDGRLLPQYNSPVVNGVRQATPWVANPNNVRDFFNTGVTSTNNVAFQGGDERTSFRASYTYLDQKGMLENTFQKKHTFAVNGSSRLHQKLKLDASLTYVKLKAQLPGFGYDAQNVMQQFMWSGRQVDIPGLKNYTNADGSKYNWNYNYHNNPYFTLYENTSVQDRDRLYGATSLNYYITKELSVRARTGIDWFQNIYNTRRAFGDIDNSRGYFYTETRTFLENNTDLLISYNKEFADGKFGIAATAGGNLMMQQAALSYLEAKQLATPGIYNVGNADGTPGLGNSTSQKQIHSVYGTLQLAYNKAFFLDFTARNDWSSTLPKENNSYFYPGVNASAVINELVPALKDVSFINLLKVRGGWSQVGSDTDPYRLKNVYSSSDKWGGSLPTFVTGDFLANNQLKPEIQTTAEVGLEGQFFSNRLGFSATFYNRETKDQIVPIQISQASGYTNAYVNSGIVSNKGIELTINATPVQAGDFRWDVNLAFAKNNNKVESQPIPSLIMGTYWSLQVRSDVGSPIGTLFGRDYLRDEQGNIVHANGIPQRNADLTVLGNATPDWTGGLNNSFTYKGVRVSALLDVRKGGDLYSMTTTWGRYAGVLEETLVGREGGIVGEGVMQVGTTNDGKPVYERNNVAVSAERYNKAAFDNNLAGGSIFDGTFVKLREVQLGYTLPNKWLGSKSPIRDISISVVGRNLALLYARVPHIDPETAFNNGNVQGLEFGQIPSARSIGFNVNFKL